MTNQYVCCTLMGILIAIVACYQVFHVTTENCASLHVAVTDNVLMAHKMIPASIIPFHRLSRQIKGQTYGRGNTQNFLPMLSYRTIRQSQLSSKLTLLTLLQIDPTVTPLHRNHGLEYG